MDSPASSKSGSEKEAFVREERAEMVRTFAEEEAKACLPEDER
jgi:hypothetical protein